MISESAFVAVWISSLILIYALLRSGCSTLSMIRGPPSPSFILGNLIDVMRRPVGEAELAWKSQYGNVVRFKSVFGEDRLFIADPKALRRILNTSTDIYQKLSNYRIMTRMITGKGLVWAEGEDHKRQKSIMVPGFGHKECSVFFLTFKTYAESLGMKWTEIIESNNSHGVTVDVIDWLSRATLDAIGHAAFDIQFNTIQDDSHILAKAYRNYFGEVFGLPSAAQIFILAASKYVPMRVLEWLTDHGPGTRLERSRDVANIVTSLAKELVQEKAAALLAGKGNTDIFTLLVKANMDASATKGLSDDELVAQMRTILIGGHETTANSLSWILLELARNPKVQSKLRNEIRKTGQQLSVAELAAMPYLNAVIKEGLRFHPVVPQILRIAQEDDVLPLSKPILTESGNTINEILVPKGTEFVISIHGYNRCDLFSKKHLSGSNWTWNLSDPDLWGEDAHEFNPDRWLNGDLDKISTGLGVYSNLLTFNSGARVCIGWRFAVTELQAFLSTLVGKFEFAMTDKAKWIVQLPMIVKAPMVDGEFDRGVQMPLTISLAPEEGDS